MIEVEKKFLLKDEDVARLIDGAEFVGEFIIDDTYYDTREYRLTKKDKWLRKRNGAFELKNGLVKEDGGFVGQYEEIEDEEAIAQVIDVPFEKDLANTLEKHKYETACECKTVRRKYRRDGFTIDLDVVEFPGWTYTIGEVELIVSDVSEIKDAEQRIIDFGKKYGLSIAEIHGKAVEYLKRCKPDHYEALSKAGALRKGL